MKKLKNSEVEQLLKFGCDQEEVDYIETVLPYIVFEDENDKRISITKVRKALSTEEFCSGVKRAVYHWTAVRGDIFFNATKWFKS